MKCKDAIGWVPDENYACMWGDLWTLWDALERAKSLEVADIKTALRETNITGEHKALLMTVHDSITLPESFTSGITGTVVTGYEKVALGATEQLVPLLYPTALKLEKAAIAASQQGYRLKIYDAYRPGQASDKVREITEGLLEQPIPETTYQNIPQPEMPTVAEGEILTYNRLMTNNSQYSINYFIAGYGSRHNFGVALDLTLEDAENRQELVMQSAIHDLSYYAVLARNQENANALSRIMKGAGFATLVSEWWHFQDNDAINTLGLKALWAGVSVEGWKADNTGWRYRRASGSYYKDCTRTIGGVSYTFDEQGYVIP
jgi:D-alanyl-D-alanine dipeptidase